MGYVHDTAMTLWIAITAFLYSAGTWTHSVASNVWYNRRTAADASFTVHIPIPIPQNSAALKGSKLVSVDVWFKVATAALDALEAHIYKNTLAADGAAMSAAELTSTYDTGHDAAAERIDADEHKMTLTLDEPVWLDDDDQVYMEIVVDAAATSVFDIFGARANYTLRL